MEGSALRARKVLLELITCDPYFLLIMENKKTPTFILFVK